MFWEFEFWIEVYYENIRVNIDLPASPSRGGVIRLFDKMEI